jgi:hypothetical protein
MERISVISDDLWARDEDGPALEFKAYMERLTQGAPWQRGFWAAWYAQGEWPPNIGQKRVISAALLMTSTYYPDVQVTAIASDSRLDTPPFLDALWTQLFRVFAREICSLTQLC